MTSPAAVLDEMDPYDPATTKTDALAQKVKELIERTTMAAQTNAEKSSKAIEEETNEITETDIPTAESSTIPKPSFRAISLTRQIHTGPPVAKSTPMNPNTRPAPLFPIWIISLRKLKLRNQLDLILLNPRRTYWRLSCLILTNTCLLTNTWTPKSIEKAYHPT